MPFALPFGDMLDTVKGFAPFVIALVSFRVLVWCAADYVHEAAGTGRWKVKGKRSRNTRGGR